MSAIGWDIGVAMLSEYDADGFIGIQVDAFGEEYSGVEPYEAHHTLGFVSRPRDPEVDSEGNPKPEASCTVLYGMEGPRGHAMLLGDPRSTAKLPKLKKGGAMFYAPAAKSYALFDGIDEKTGKRPGSFTVATALGDTGKSHVLSLDVRADGKEAVSLKHGAGHGLDLGADGSALLRNQAGDAWLSANDDGVDVSGAMTVQGSLAVGAPAAQAVVLADPLIAYLTALEAALAAHSPPIIVQPISSIALALKTKNFLAT